MLCSMFFQIHNILHVEIIRQDSRGKKKTQVHILVLFFTFFKKKTIVTYLMVVWFLTGAAVWCCWPGKPGSHTQLWGRLACCLSPAEENHWWHSTHSSKRYIPITEHCSHPSILWRHPEGLWEGCWPGGVEGLGWWHSKPLQLSFKGNHCWNVDDKHQTHWAC